MNRILGGGGLYKRVCSFFDMLSFFLSLTFLSKQEETLMWKESFLFSIEMCDGCDMKDDSRTE